MKTPLEVEKLLAVHDLSMEGYGCKGASLLCDDGYRQIEVAQKFLDTYCRKRKTINRDRTSYGWKHLAQSVTGEYISNGAFIAAALLKGYEMDGSHHKNQFLNIGISQQCRTVINRALNP